MKCQSLLCEKDTKTIVNLSSVEITQKVVRVNYKT